MADHPRIRGEHPVLLVAGDGVLGSSPHTRGAPKLVAVTHRRHRIIPAYAGSTIPPRSQLMSPADHPRIRGEHP